MKYCFYLLMATVAAWAQSVAATYTTDLNGHRVPDSLVRTSAKGEVTEVRQSINGRQVPMQKTETRVVSDTPAGRVTETIVRRYDQEGNLAATERTVSNEQKRADGGSTVHATIYRSDLNGTLQEAERRVVETQKQGTVTTSDVSLARAGLSGSFETFEKRKVVTTTAPGKVSEDETVYRPNNGQFIEAVRRTREERKENGNDVSVATTYLPDYSGRMAFLRQDVATTKKAPDGSQVTELNIFAPTVDGLVAENGAGPKLKEQQLIMRQPAGTGVVKESVSVRRPSLSDPTHLGTPQTISETLCSGKCLTEPPAAR